MDFTELLSKYGIDTLIIALLTVVATGFVKLPLKWLADKFKSSKKITRFITFLPLFTGFGATVLVNMLLKQKLFFGQAFYVQWLTSVSLSLAIYAFWEKFVPSEKKILSAAALEENREAVERLKKLLTENRQTPQEAALPPDAEQTQILKKNFNQGVKKMDKNKLQDFIAKAQAKSSDSTGDLKENSAVVTYAENVTADSGELKNSTDPQDERTLKTCVDVTESDRQFIQGEFACLDGQNNVIGNIDYIGLLHSRGLTIEVVKKFELILLGRTIAAHPPHHESIDVYDQNGKFIYTSYTFIDSFTCYPIDLSKIYEETGRCDFEVKPGRNCGSESLWRDMKLNIEIDNPESISFISMPKKFLYKPGEAFDDTGMSIKIRFASGKVETVDNSDRFNISPSVLQKGVTGVTIKYYEKTLTVPVEVIGDDWDKTEEKNYKKFDLCDKVNGYLDLSKKTIVTQFGSFENRDFVIPLNISHIYRPEAQNGSLGAGWRSSLDRQLNLSASDTEGTTIYTYVDEFGDAYTLNEKYYTVEGGEKVFIEKDKVSIDPSGNLSYNNKPVYKHCSCGGYTLVPKIDDFINSEFIEQKQQEQVELENLVQSYRSSLLAYVLYNTATNQIETNEMTEVTVEHYKNFIDRAKSDENILLLSKSEALQLQSAKFSLNNLDIQIKQLDLQNSQIDLQIKQQEQQIVDYDSAREYLNAKLLKYDYGELDYLKNKDYDDLKSAESFRKYLKDHSPDSDLQCSINVEEKSLTQSQITNLNAQINYIINNAKKNLPQVEEAFKRYFNKKHELELLLRQTPVNFLKDTDGIISGFNEDGKLVYLCDAYNNYVTIDYTADGKISGVYDSNGKAMEYLYDGNLLVSITDDLAATVKYGYTGNNLTSVTFADGSVVKFAYTDDKITAVERCGITRTEIGYGANSRVTSVNVLSVPVTFAKETSELPVGFTEKVSGINVSYANSDIKIAYDDGSSEVYTLYPSGRISYHTVQTAMGIKNVEAFYFYFDSANNKVSRTVTTSDISEPKDIICTYNNFDLIVSETSAWRRVSAYLKVKHETSYEYDTENRLSKERTVKYSDVSGTVTSFTNLTEYHYNSRGALTLTESGVEGEELVSGKNIEERKYDANGNLTRVSSWNTLNSSSKFYTESVYAENGQVTGDKDETGALCAEYDYLDGTNIIKSVRHSNGSTLAYGRNAFNYNVTSVTQSTENGESNTSDIIYCHGLPVEVSSGNTVMQYEYDHKRRKTAIIVNGEIYETYTYSISGTQKSVQVTNANGDTWVTTSDCNGNVNNISCNGTSLLSCSYNSKGLPTKRTDHVTGEDEIYSYDSYGFLTGYVRGGYSESYKYTTNGEISEKSINGSAVMTYAYAYKDNAARDLDYIGFDTYKFKPLCDANGRYTGKEIYAADDKICAEYISYRKVGDHATAMPSAVWYGSGTEVKENISYAYDSCGNIAEIRENGGLAVRYAYDALNRIIREDNKRLGKTVMYAYDRTGNIISKRITAFTTKTEVDENEFEEKLYGYNGDKLITYNGEVCEYNAMGSPTVYRGKNASWQYGKLLSSYDGTEFTYDGSGKRLTKGEIQFTYDSDGRLVKQSDGLEYVYDADGIIGVKYNNTQYFYRKDAQGNIIAILDSRGAVVVKYIYDAWGNHAVVDTAGNNIEDSTHIGNKNPFRYNGYYYDVETDLYYLQTRYYDPETGRFISQDSIDYADPETINGLNLYAYCGNNPVMNEDPTGHWSWKKFWKGVAKVVAAVAVVAVITAATVFTAGAAAMALGATTAVVNAVVAGAALGGMVAGAFEIGSQIYNNGIENINFGSVALSAFTGAAFGAVGGAMGSTTSAGVRLAMRGVSVGIGVFDAGVKSAINGDSLKDAFINMGLGLAAGIGMNGAGMGRDYFKGFLSSARIQVRALNTTLFSKNSLAYIGVMAILRKSFKEIQSRF